MPAPSLSMDTFKDFMHRIPFDPYSSLNQRIVDALIGGVSLFRKNDLPSPVK